MTKQTYAVTATINTQIESDEHIEALHENVKKEIRKLLKCTVEDFGLRKVEE